MNILIRQLGEHRGSPRLYLDSTSLCSAGFNPGTMFSVSCDRGALRVSLRVDPAGVRKVSRKRRGEAEVPVIDLNSTSDLAQFRGHGAVRVVVLVGEIHILLPATVHKALARTARLAARLACGQPLQAAGLAFGAGIASRALHDGLAAGGVPAQLALANELCEDYIELAAERNPCVLASTTKVAAPMQELATDDWLLARLPKVDVLEAGIPCSGASRAGVSKRGLSRMEDHPTVGHLVGAAIQLIGALQPAIVVIENVVSYRESASAAILRGWLADAGYAIHELVLNSAEFGSLEERIRWFLVACPPQIELDLARLGPCASAGAGQQRLADVLDDIGPDDDRYRAVKYLKDKATRDAAKGSHFAMQMVTPDARRVPTLRKGYQKGGSTDPRLLHPTDPNRSRLLTGREHARIKGIDPALVAGLSDTMAHQVCGQAVDTRPVHAIVERLGQTLRKWLAASVPVPEPVMQGRLQGSLAN